ncbi:MAG: DUF1292 domain-containing protein [Clostridia bacterium]|nr:DUF1292 domain-containing protein [Clostridia bacterium]
MAKYERFIDRFFDENNFDNVKLQDEDGNEFEFEQVALVDYEGEYYVILDPVTKIEGIGEDEVYVFMIDENEDGLVLVEDIDVVQGVFNVYYEMLEDEE